MQTIRVVSVRGRCNAGLKVGETFVLDAWRIVSPNADKLCCVALAAIVASASRWKVVGRGELYISCPDPATGEGGNVIFQLASPNNHEDYQH